MCSSHLLRKGRRTRPGGRVHGGHARSPRTQEPTTQCRLLLPHGKPNQHAAPGRAAPCLPIQGALWALCLLTPPSFPFHATLLAGRGPAAAAQDGHRRARVLWPEPAQREAMFSACSVGSPVLDKGPARKRILFLLSHGPCCSPSPLPPPLCMLAARHWRPAWVWGPPPLLHSALPSRYTAPHSAAQSAAVPSCHAFLAFLPDASPQPPALPCPCSPCPCHLHHNRSPRRSRRWTQTTSAPSTGRARSSGRPRPQGCPSPRRRRRPSRRARRAGQ